MVLWEENRSFFFLNTLILRTINVILDEILPARSKINQSKKKRQLKSAKNDKTIRANSIDHFFVVFGQKFLP